MKKEDANIDRFFWKPEDIKIVPPKKKLKKKIVLKKANKSNG